MATSVIQNSCVCGVMFGLMTTRFIGSFTAVDADGNDIYAEIASTARAIADEFITENTASSSPLDDSDNAQIGALVQSIAEGSTYLSGAISVKQSDYAKYGQQIYAATKEALGQLV